MIRFLRILLAGLLLLPLAASANSEPKANLTIIADEDMLLPLAQIARSYAMASNTPLTVVVKNADDAERQIEQGLEAHVIITANYPLLDRLINQGLTDVTSRRTVARTQLALVSASNFGRENRIAKRISFAAMINTTDNVPVYAIAPGTAEGDRAKQLMSGYEFSAALAPRIELKANREELIEALRDDESFGLILATDAADERDLTVLSLLPPEISPPVTYDATVLGSESMSEAKEFVNYLGTREADRIFAHFGFQTYIK